MAAALADAALAASSSRLQLPPVRGTVRIPQVGFCASVYHRSQLDPDRMRSSIESSSRAYFVLRSHVEFGPCTYASIHLREQTYRWQTRLQPALSLLTLDLAESPLASVQASSSLARSLLERQNSCSLAGTSRYEMAMHLTNASSDL